VLRTAEVTAVPFPADATADSFKGEGVFVTVKALSKLSTLPDGGGNVLQQRYPPVRLIYPVD
jgi:hypothetical protein